MNAHVPVIVHALHSPSSMGMSFAAKYFGMVRIAWTARTTTLYAFFLALGSLCFASGCDSLSRLERAIEEVLGDPPPPIPPKHPKHDLVIQAGKVFYNETFIGPGVSVDVWKKLFGEPSWKGIDSLTWGNMGMGVATDEDDVMSIDVYFEPVPVNERERAAVGTFYESEPEQAFPGRVLLDGAALYPGVKINHIDRRFKSDCKPPGGGFGFREAALPGHYVCRSSAYSYWLAIYVVRDGLKGGTTFARVLQISGYASRTRRGQ